MSATLSKYRWLAWEGVAALTKEEQAMARLVQVLVQLFRQRGIGDTGDDF